MATNIEQIFRSFVVSKFREIQEQQFGGGKVGVQHNGEINSSEQVNPSDDTIASIGNLQNDPLVQKIEQVLSEVLGAESQYRSDDQEDSVKNKSRSYKRGLSEEVQDEIPRKKSKKDKKHKDKKKKKKRKKEKKEKKYKRQSKESKLNAQQDECEEMSPCSHSKPENSSSLVSTEDVDIQSASALTQGSSWIKEKSAHESLNSTTSNSHDAFSSDTSKLDTSEDDSALIRGQEIRKVDLTTEKELQNDSYQTTNLTVNLFTENESLNTSEADGSAVCTARSGVSYIEVEQPEASSVLEATEKVSVPGNSPHSVAVELEDAEMSLESDTMEVKSLDSVPESLYSDSMKQSVTTSFETTGCKFVNAPLEAVAEAKDSVTTLGFLAMVVGKDFEATSEFLNTAKVKASERSPKHTAITDVKDLVHDTERITAVKDLQKNLQFESRAELKDSEGTPESLHEISGKSFESAVESKLKPQPDDSERITKFDVQKSMAETLATETMARKTELKATQGSVIVMESQDSEKYAGPQEIVADAKDLREPEELEVMSRTNSEVCVSNVVEAKNLDTASACKKIDMTYLKAKSQCASEMENVNTVPEPLGMMGARTLDCPPGFQKTTQEQKGESKIIEDSDTVIEVKVHESSSQSKVPEISGLEAISETSEIMKTQNLEFSEYLSRGNMASKLVNLKDMENVSEPLMTVKNVENTSSQNIEEIRDVDIVQSDAGMQRNDLEISLEPEAGKEEKDLDATSKSLHMIFTNYSEHSLELYTEPEVMMELRGSETVPESVYMLNANSCKALHTGEVKDLKTVESETMAGLNVLQKKLGPLQRDVQNVDAAGAKAVPPVKYSGAFEAEAKGKQINTVSQFITSLEEVSDTTGIVEKDQNAAEAYLEILPSYEKVTKTDLREKTGNKLFVEGDGPFCSSKFLEKMDVIGSEKTPKLGATAVIQELKETNLVDVGGLKETELKNSASVDSADNSNYVSIVKGFETSSECQAEQNIESLQHVKAKVREVNLDSVYDLEDKYARTSPEFLLPDELSNQEEKQNLEERTELTAPESLSVSERAVIMVPESHESKEVIACKHGPESRYVLETKQNLDANIIVVKDVEIDSEPTFHAGEKNSDVPEYESSRKNEVLLESQSLSMLQESGTTLRSDTLTLQTVEAHSEMVRVSNTENLKVPSQCEELVVVGELEEAPGSRFALGTLNVKTTPLLVHATEDEELKATKTIGTGANIDKLMGSTESVVLEETFEPICVMDVKDLEASQKLETDLDSVAQKEINNLHTGSSHKADVNAAETLKKTGHLVDAYISEDIVTTAEEKDSGPVLEPDAKYSESFFESTTISEKDNSDTNLSMFVTDVKDSAAGSSALGTGELNNLKAVLHFERTSTPLCALDSRDSNDAVASLPKTEIKDIRKTLNYERVLEVKDPVVCAAHLSTPEVTPSESVSLSEVTDCIGFIELKTTPADIGDLKSSGTTAETTSLIIDPEIHLQQEHSSIVKYLDTTSEAECVVETLGNKTTAESECTMEEKVSETISEVVCLGGVESLEAIPKHIQETKDLESLSQVVHTVNAKDLEGSIHEDVLNVSGTTQISSAVERTDLANASMVAEAVKGSEYPKYTEEMLGNVDVKNAQEKLGFVAIVELKDSEPTLTSKTAVEYIHSKEPVSFETTKCKSVGEVKVAQTSTDKEPQMDFEETSKSVLNFERQNLEKNSTSVLLSEVDTSEVSLESVQVMHVKDSAHECMSARNIEISEQHSKCLSETEPKVLESTVGFAELTQAKNLEVILPLTEEAKHSGTTLEDSCMAKEKDLNGTPQLSLVEQGIKEAPKPVCPTVKDNYETNQQMTVLKDSEVALEPVHATAEKSVKVGEQVITETKDSEAALEPVLVEKEKDLDTTLEDSMKDHDSVVTPKSSDIMKENEESALKDKKSEKISSKSKDKSKSGKKAKKSRSKSPSKSKKRKKKSRSRSTSRQVASRRGRSRSKTDSSSRKKHSTSRHKSRSRSADKKESKDSSVRSRRRRSRTSDLKSRSRSPEKRETSVRSRQRRSRSSDRHKSRSRSVDRRESARRRRRLSRSSDNHKSRSRSIDRRERVRSRRRQSRSSDRRKSRSRSIDKRETSVRTRRRRSQSSDRYKSRSRSLDRRESSVRTRRRQSRSSDRHKSRSRSVDDRRESSVRTRRRRSRSRDTRKSRSRSVDRRETVRARRRRSRSSDNHKSRSRSVDKRESTARIRRRRSRSSDNRRSKSKSVDKRETSIRTRRRRSVSSDRKSRSKSVDKRETSVRAKRKRSKSSDRKSRSRSVENGDTSARSKRRRSKSTDHKSRTKSDDKIESSSRSRHRRSKSSDRRMSKSKSRSKSSERKDKDSLDESRGKHSKYRSKSKSLEKTEGTDSVEVPMRNRTKSPEKQKSKSRSRSKSIDKTREKENLRRSRSKGSKSPEPRSRRRRTVSRSRRNRSRSRKRGSRSKSVQRSRTRSRSRSRSCSRRWRRTRSRSLSRLRSLSRERRRRSRRNRSRSTDRRRRRSDSRDSYRISLRLRSRSRTPARLRCSRSTGRRRSASKSPDHRRSRSSSRSPKRLTDLDKAQLLEIAKANAAAMCAKAGVPLLPSLMPVITPEKKEEKVTQKSAKETILELTEKCKKIAQSQEDDVIVNKPHVSDEEEEEHPFINHPFKLNEPKPIFFNLTTPTIKPAPPKTQVTLTKEFPVSSGSQHRKKEADSAYGEWVPVEKNKDENKDDVFPNPANLEPVDISSALNERQIAQKRLTENTFDLEAMCLLNRAQERIDAWAELNSIPGHFTGSTGVQVLSSEQLSNSGPQAWVKKDQFLRAAPVSGGMGAQLMRKMGWREGEGLGKNKEGNKEPILVDFKTDRKGLVAVGEKTQKRHRPFSTVKDLSGKHPVSALLEVCNKRRWSPPVFVLVNDNRPEYRKHFLFKVMVNGVEHKPSFVSPNKKHAKATAATVALQALGLVPKELLANATNFRSASHN